MQECWKVQDLSKWKCFKLSFKEQIFLYWNLTGTLSYDEAVQNPQQFPRLLLLLPPPPQTLPVWAGRAAAPCRFGLRGEGTRRRTSPLQQPGKLW